MFRRNLFCAAILGILGTAAIHSTALACKRAFPQPIIVSLADRVAQAESVVIGKVVRVEGKSEFVTLATPDVQNIVNDYQRDLDVLEKVKVSGQQPVAQPVEQKMEYQVYVVEVKETLAGSPGLTHVRVGLPVLQNANIYYGIDREIGFGKGEGYYQPQATNLGIGATACFFLRTDANCSFFPANHHTILSKFDDASFAAQTKQVKQLAKLIDKPMDGLKSKDASDRFVTAAMLLHRYRAVPPSAKSKTEAVDAEQSRLIVEALLEVDWNQQNPMSQKMPYHTFTLLGLTDEDGWKMPQSIQSNNDYRAALAQWHKDNGGKYRLQKYVHTN